MHISTFDKIIQDEGIGHIGILFGTNDVLYIKTGQGGSIFGYENKYLNMANRIRDTYGYTVIVSSTVGDTEQLWQKEWEYVNSQIAIENVHFMGVSKGGLIGIWHASKKEKVRRILAVNAPLMINFQNKTVPVLQNCKDKQIRLVYGTQDPSYSFVPFLRQYESEEIKVETVAGADHHFKGLDELFQSLPERYLLERK